MTTLASSGTNSIALRTFESTGCQRLVGLLLALSALGPQACAPIASQPTLGNGGTVFATQPSSTVFAIIGDYGYSPQTRKRNGQPAIDPPGDVARLVKSWEPDFIVTTGDNIITTIAERQNRLMTTLDSTTTPSYRPTLADMGGARLKTNFPLPWEITIGMPEGAANLTLQPRHISPTSRCRATDVTISLCEERCTFSSQ
jgi:hypothetical protein